MANTAAAIAAPVSAALVIGLLLGLLLACICHCRRQWRRRRRSLVFEGQSLCTIHIDSDIENQKAGQKGALRGTDSAASWRISAGGENSRQPAAPFEIHADATSGEAVGSSGQQQSSDNALGTATALHRSIVRASLRSALSAPEELPSFAAAAAAASAPASRGSSPPRRAFLTRLASGSWASYKVGTAAAALPTAVSEDGGSPPALGRKTMSAAGEVRLEEVCLAERIGSGASSTVYRGAWRGAPCAVKFTVCDTGDAAALRRATREVVLSKRMSHPHVAQTYAWTICWAGEQPQRQVANTPRAQRVLSRSGMASFATRMTPIADEAPSTADAAAAAAAAASHTALGFSTVLSMPAAAGPLPAQQSGGIGCSATDDLAASSWGLPAITSLAAAAAGADVFLPPSSGASNASGNTFESALASGSSSSGGSNRSSTDDGHALAGGSSASAAATAGTAPQLQVASAPPAGPAAASCFQLPEPAAAAASAGPKTAGRRRPVRRVLTFTEADGGVSEAPSLPTTQRADSPPPAAAGDAAAEGNVAGRVAALDAAAAGATAPAMAPQWVGKRPATCGDGSGRGNALLPVAWQEAAADGSGDENAVPAAVAVPGAEPASRLATPQPGHTLWDGVVEASTGRREAPPGTRLGRFSTPAAAAADVPLLLGAGWGGGTDDAAHAATADAAAAANAAEAAAAAAQTEAAWGFDPSWGRDLDAASDSCFLHPADPTAPAGGQAAAGSGGESDNGGGAGGGDGGGDRGTMRYNKLFEWAQPEVERHRIAVAAAAAGAGGIGRLAAMSPTTAFNVALPPPVWSSPKQVPEAGDGPVPPPSAEQPPLHVAPPPVSLSRLHTEPSEHEHSSASPESFNSEQGFGSPVRRHYAYGYRDGSAAAEVAALHGSQAVLVTVMEFCDLGTLADAVRRNVFQPRPGGRWAFDHTYRALLRTAAEVAKALDFMHSLGVVHGDLKPANVLLKTHRADRRGYVAKVADFGLSRELVGGDTEQEVGSALGTVPYTAPEVFDSGRPTTSSDVYAFGILLWEMWHGKAAHAGLLEAQICAAVCNDGARPAWDAGTPPQLAALGSACWAQNPAARPSFQEVAQRLAFIEEDFRLAWHRQRQLRAAAAAELGFGNAARGMLTPPR